jgi:L-ribulose-5-phosphate 4-epimerase
MPGVLVQGHGPFAWGASGRLALDHAVALEIVADLALKTLALNPSLSPIPPALLDKHFLRKHGPGKYYGQEK